MAFKKATKEACKARVALYGPSGSGKAQPLDAKVLTPTGYVEMGSLVVGDYVIGSDGHPKEILGVYPQGEKDIYKIELTDGTSVECCDEHLWLTQTTLDRAAGRAGTVKPLREIRANIRDKHGKYNHYLPMVKPVEFDESELPLDPYLLGVLLGDGGLNKNCVTVSNPEVEIQESVMALLPASVELRSVDGVQKDFAIRRIAAAGPNEVVDVLRQLGLDGTRSDTKFIPQQYLYSSAASRTALLQGLLDTDGYAGGVTLEYSTSSLHLANGVRFIVESLGGTVGMSSRHPKFKYKGECKTGKLNYRLNVKLPPTIKPFRLSRKATAHTPKTKYQPVRAIKSIVFVGRKQAQCIAVLSEDHLYVTDHCIVTHNTYTALRMATGMGKRIAVIDTEYGSASKYADRFEFDTLDLRKPTIDNVVTAFRDAAGYDVLILDSMTHSWQELLQEIEKLAQAKYKGNTWSAWSEGTPKQKQLVNAILSFGGHVIATMRSKTEWTQETGSNGRSKPVRVGLAPEQGKSVEYEFDLLMSITVDHIGHVEKDRSGKFQDAIIEKPGEDFGRELAAWLSDGAAPPKRESEPEPPAKPKPGERRNIGTVPEEHHAYCLEVEHEINHNITRAEDMKHIADMLAKKPAEVRDYLRPIYAAKMAVLNGSGQTPAAA